MHILHLLSQRELTGAEVYALTLARHQVRAGHRCMVVSDRLNVACDLPFLALPIGDRRLRTRFSNVLELRRLVRSAGVDLIHAHSRAASWVASLVTRLTGVAYVSTVHGRQSLHFTSRHLNVYGRHVIAVCPFLAEHLVADLRLPPAAVRYIPNALE